MNSNSLQTSNSITERLAALEAQSRAERQIVARTRRQLRVTWAASFFTVAIMLTFGWHKDAIAQGYGMTLAQAATRIAALETKTASMSVVSAGDASNTSGQQTVRFSGVNVQIVDGTGSTEGTQSGLGNLIVGYNERVSSTGRTGNHNLITGSGNNYTSNGGVVFGFNNSISNLEATVTGGAYNTASGDTSSVSGGYRNKASNYQASVSGGNNNTASGFISSVSGGGGNTASGNQASVSGGSRRTASDESYWAAGTYSSTP